MAKISGSIASFANGVSQQAMAIRRPSEENFQVNAYSTVIEGLKKRPPTQRRASLGTGVSANIQSHMINRDAAERYEVIMSSSGIRVFDLTTGDERTVSVPDGYSYLSYTGNGKPPYRALTVGDYTFITNTTKAVALDASIIETVSPSEAIIHVLAGNYGKDYKITINGAVVAWYRTPDGTSAAQSPAVDTNFIARRLAFWETVALATTVNGKPNGDWVWKASDVDLNGSGINAANGWTVKVTKGTIYLKKNDGAAFSVGVEDGYNGHAMKAIQKTTQDFADLPAFCEEGMAVKITGSVSTQFDDYFVRFGKQSPTDNISTPGVWREVSEPGIQKAFDAATMPHVLVREANGTFTFKKSTWEQRRAGDNKTVPAPSFVGKGINEITFFKNRLGFLAGENVILSRAGEFFDFWRATATALLDDDPIDVASTDVGVSVLRSAIGFADRLIMFADQNQVVLMGNELLTPKTASIRPTTAYSTSSKARPVSSGASVFFPVDRGQFSMIREYRIDENNSAVAEDITGHVPQYLPGSVIKMAASTHEDILLVQTDVDPGALYVYKYYWSGNEKLQQSWSRWEFPGVKRILDMGFVASQLILTLERDNETFIEVMDVEPGGVDPHSTFISHLDRRFLVSNVPDTEFDAYENLTTIPMEVDVRSLDYRCVTAGSSTSGMNPGLEVEVVERGFDYVVVRGDMRSVPLYFGTLYTMRYRLSTIFIRKSGTGGSSLSITEGRLQLLQLLIQYSKTAFFRVEVTPLGAVTREYFTNGRLMGDPENKVDRVHLADGTFRLPILCKNDRVKIEIVNDSYMPCSLLSAEWIANYVNKSKRL